MGFSDAVIVGIAVLLADQVVTGDHSLAESSHLLYMLLGHIAPIIGLFSWKNVYRSVLKYARYADLVATIKWITVTELLFYSFTALIWIPLTDVAVPPSLSLVSWAFTTIGLCGCRMIGKIVADSKRRKTPCRHRTLIVGAGSGGVLVAKELLRAEESDFLPVAFVDDDPQKLNLHVYGLPVVGTRRDIPEVVKRFGITKVVLAMPSAPTEVISQTLALCKHCHVEVRMLPRVADLLYRDFSVKMIRSVKVEDLLGREPIHLDTASIAQYLKGKVVLVTGAGGTIGSELSRQIAAFGPRKLLLLGRGENSIFEIEQALRRQFPDFVQVPIIADIKDRTRLMEVMREHRPSVVFHAAAHKHVPLMEINPVEAVKNNILGTKNVAECAAACGVDRFVLISTDKAVNPSSVMGATKRVAELLVQAFNEQSATKFSVVRFGNVLGSRGSVIPVFQRQIEEGGPVTVTHPEMTRYFMTITEAAQLVIQAGALATGGEIFTLDMGKPIKIADLAQDLIRLSGLVPHQDVKIVYVGMRPGEKLSEELFRPDEVMTATMHERIFVGMPTVYPRATLFHHISELEKVIQRSDPFLSKQEIVRGLQAILPDYRPEWSARSEARTEEQAALPLPSFPFEQPQIGVTAK